MAEFQLGIPVNVVVYQCGTCRFQSAHKKHLVAHLKRTNNTCGDATILQHKCAFVPRADGPGDKPEQGSSNDGAGQTIVSHGDHNTNTNTHINHQINQFIIVPSMACVGSEEERQALMDLLRKSETLENLANLPAEEIPATLLRLWKGADAPPELKNIRVVGDKVEEFRQGNRVVAVPRKKFVKKTVGDMLDTVDNVVDTLESSTAADIKHELHTKRFKCGRQHVTPKEAARMYASSAKQAYSLDADGRAFISKTAEGVDKELDHV